MDGYSLFKHVLLIYIILSVGIIYTARSGILSFIATQLAGTSTIEDILAKTCTSLGSEFNLHTGD
jgi:hypothetical protein